MCFKILKIDFEALEMNFRQVTFDFQAGKGQTHALGLAAKGVFDLFFTLICWVCFYFYFLHFSCCDNMLHDD